MWDQYQTSYISCSAAVILCAHHALHNECPPTYSHNAKQPMQLAQLVSNTVFIVVDLLKTHTQVISSDRLRANHPSLCRHMATSEPKRHCQRHMMPTFGEKGGSSIALTSSVPADRSKTFPVSPGNPLRKHFPFLKHNVKWPTHTYVSTPHVAALQNIAWVADQCFFRRLGLLLAPLPSAVVGIRCGAPGAPLRMWMQVIFCVAE